MSIARLYVCSVYGIHESDTLQGLLEKVAASCTNYVPPFINEILLITVDDEVKVSREEVIKFNADLETLIEDNIAREKEAEEYNRGGHHFTDNHF